MAPSKLRRAIGAVKDKTSIGLAKVGSSASLADLDIAIVKATRHEEHPPEERHIREILSLTCYSSGNIGACVSAISRRLDKTKNWVVALKTLALIHRLINDGDPLYEQEIFFATRRGGTRLLNVTNFRDSSRPDSWDYSAFVRTYALYLDEQLEFRTQGRRVKLGVLAYYEEEEEAAAAAAAGGHAPMKATPVHDMRNDSVLIRVQNLMQLLERFLACRPTGSAKQNRVVQMALYPLVKESFQLYYDISEIQAILIDRFIGLEVADCVKVHEIFCLILKQLNELEEFYGWCQNVGIARSSEYPEVDRITQRKLDAMDNYIRDKSASMHNRRVVYQEHKNETEEEDGNFIEEDNAIKALPPPEGFPADPATEGAKEEPKEKPTLNQKEIDLLDLGEDMVTNEDHGDKLALALFDGGAPAYGAQTTTVWEAFKDAENWETALVESASHLSNQKPSLPGGFDTMLLDNMYQQGAILQAMASSSAYADIALGGSAGWPAMALPAPLAVDHGSAAATMSADPFAASLPVPPPSYVQMSETEKKQRWLVQEQLMWQQYALGGMQGQAELAKIQTNPYPYYTTGDYTQLLNLYQVYQSK